MTPTINTEFRLDKAAAVQFFLTKDLGNWFATTGQKPWFRQLREMVDLLVRYRFPPYQYLKHDLYRAEIGHCYRSYIPSVFADRYVHEINPRECIDWLEDKLAFDARMRAAGLPLIETLAAVTLTEQGLDIVDRAGAALTLPQVFADAKARGLDMVFLKPRYGIAGRGAFRLRVGERSFERDGALVGEEELATRLAASGYRDFLMQPFFVQHPELARLNPGAVNTLRVYSFEVEGRIDIIAAFLRVGTGAGETDNVANGGISVYACLDTGVLHGPATANLRYADRRYLPRHPTTDVQFDTVKLHHVDKVRDLVVRGARACQPLRIIGWDIGIGPDGPVVFEANAIPGMRPIQDLCGGLMDTSYGREIARWRKWGK